MCSATCAHAGSQRPARRSGALHGGSAQTLARHGLVLSRRSQPTRMLPRAHPQAVPRFHHHAEPAQEAPAAHLQAHHPVELLAKPLRGGEVGKVDVAVAQLHVLRAVVPGPVDALHAGAAGGASQASRQPTLHCKLFTCRAASAQGTALRQVARRAAGRRTRAFRKTP